MILTKQDFINKIHLIISVLIVVPVSFVYGSHPSLLFDIHLNTIDAYSVFKAIMGLYLGFSILWILGVFIPKYQKFAQITNMVFMLGLGFGRLMGLLIDGVPTAGFVFGTFAELILGFYGVWVLSRMSD